METMTTKRCSRCERELPGAAFYKRKDGLDSYCRECRRAYQREQRKKNAARSPDEVVVPSEKRCSRCKRELPVTEFAQDQNRKDGLYPYCRECYRARNREYAKKNSSRNPDEIVVPPEKRCPGCGVTRPSSEWPRNRTKPDNLAVYCKLCESARKAKYYAENGEKVREKNRRWKKANPDRVRAKHHRRRAQKAGAFTEPHTPEDLRDFWQFIGIDPDKCWYCALDGRDAPKEHTDHVIPLSKGGSETVWNKRPACARCNTSKGDKVWEAGQPMDLESERIVAEQYLATRRWMIHKGLLNPAE